ncbi:hypothetical protein [Streptomyces sp. N35]|uniref:hypothetical protein n=1 Tax=Streptomyces sp. N35 TaxID=2795730 RepID=UPI0018F5636F|nr:hypothetical protein [Streptomyces sp. N35]
MNKLTRLVVTACIAGVLAGGAAAGSAMAEGTQAPAAASTAALAPVTLTSHKDGAVIPEGPVTFSGTAEPNGTVELIDQLNGESIRNSHSKRLGFTTADAQGNWSYTYTAASHVLGESHISVHLQYGDDYAGASVLWGDPASVKAPTLKQTHLTYNSPISGTGVPNTYVSLYDKRETGNVWLNNALVDANGNWSADPNMARSYKLTGTRTLHVEGFTSADLPVTWTER